MGDKLSSIAINYLPILIFIGLALVMGITFSCSSYSCKKPDVEKVSAYECGFNAFDDARMKFDVRFYLVAIFL